jgi:hypothetical protein
VTPCIFLPDENAQGCLVERTRRFRAHRPDLRPWEKNPCDNCKTGTARAEAAGPPKEEDVAKLEPKEHVLATITRKAPCVSAPILQGCAVKADELHRITKELAAEGKIKVWTDGRKTIYTLPGAPDPFAGVAKKAAPSNDATVPSKPTRRVDRPPATPPIKKSAKTERSVPAPRKPAGNGVYAAAIADLEARRSAALDQVEKFDRALETLKELA